MTEREWDRCMDPRPMLDYLWRLGRRWRDRLLFWRGSHAEEVSRRRLRLYLVACCRRIPHYSKFEHCRRAIDVVERFAEELAGPADLQDMAQAFPEMETWLMSPPDQHITQFAIKLLLDLAAWEELEMITCQVPRETDCIALAVEWDAIRAQCEAEGQAAPLDDVAADQRLEALFEEARVKERPNQASLLRDVFGPLPFRSLSPLPPDILTRNDGIVKRLATSIYEERQLPRGTLDAVRLAVLADALEEAGVSDPDLLGHCRRPGQLHVRGCWVLDRLLAKG